MGEIQVNSEAFCSRLKALYENWEVIFLKYCCDIS